MQKYYIPIWPRRALIFGMVFLFIAINGGLRESVSGEGAIRIKGAQEILVAEDVGRGGDIWPPRWCGNNALLYRGEHIGLEKIDFITKERVQVQAQAIGSINYTGLNCSPDGRWVVYEGGNILKTEKMGDLTYDEYSENWKKVGLNSTYIYRHDVSTGNKERVGVAGFDEGGPYDAISPDGTKILLGNKHILNTEAYVPEWEPVWFSTDWWERGGSIWFSDSSGVVQYNHNPNSICVEFFGEDGWGKCFELDLESKDNIGGFMLDNEDRIYFNLIDEEYMVPDPGPNPTLTVYGCEINGRGLECEVMDRERKTGDPLAFLPDGDLILQGKCILRADSWQSEGECVLDRWYGDVEYSRVSFIGISPNGRWLAFYRKLRGHMLPSGRAAYQKDLFVIDLEDD